MLSYEEARERLRALEAGDDAVRRRVEALPKGARHVGLLLLGDAIAGWDRGDELLCGLSGRHRRALFDALVPALGEHVERMWQDGAARPYQSGWDRRGFRAPGLPEASAPRRFHELATIAGRVGAYEIPGAAWLARWAPHIGYGPVPEGLLLAAVIDGGGPEADEVLEILLASASGEEEIGGMGRHVTSALLACGRPEAWQAVVRLLLTAQREEGLRQVILESADEARPEAFALLLDTVLEHGLVRFSATTRAASVWLGLEESAGDERRLHDLLERTAALQRDPAARPAALAGDAEDAYLALVATGWEDAMAAAALARPLLSDPDPERRYAAVRLLAELRLPQAGALLGEALADQDLRVAACAFDGLTRLWSAAADTFERLEAFLRRLETPAVELPAAVWPWTQRTLERAAVAGELLRWSGDRSVADVVAHLDAMDADARVVVAGRIGAEPRKGRELRAHLLRLLGDASPRVREAAIRAAGDMELADDEAQELEALLARKAGDLRRGVTALLLQRPDAAVLASADRLLAATKAPLRLGGLELLRRLADDDRSAAAARERARRYAAEHTGPGAEERTQLDALLGNEDAAPASLDDALGLLDRARLTPPARPRDLRPAYVTEAAVAVLRDLDELVHEHRDEEVEHEGFDGTLNRQRLGELHWWPAAVARGGEDAAPPVPEVWERWNTERTVRDPDGLELVRALLAPRPQSAVRMRFVGDPWRELRRHLAAGMDLPELRYPAAVLPIVRWLVARAKLPGVAAYALDVAESLLASIPSGELAALPPQPGYIGPTEPPWRRSGWGTGLDLARLLRGLRPGDWGAGELERLWRLERFAQRPASADAQVVRPPLSELTAAVLAGVATEADAIDHLLAAPREPWGAYRDLSEVSGRRPRWAEGGHEALAAPVERIRRRVVEVEIARGEAPTAASEAAVALRHSGGMDTLLALLRALGRGKLVRGWSYDNLGRETVFSRLIRVTHPGPGDTPSSFAERAAGLPERRLVELAAYAPQWARHVEAAVRRPGLASAAWWAHAHTKDDKWSVEQEVRDEWTAEVAERTRLSAQELVDGAVDVGWFRAAHAALGEEGWALLDAAAKYCSSAGGHKRAQLFATAMLGAIAEEELAARIGAKRHQDSVRALGLLPLPAEERDAVLLRRYEALQAFARESRQFGSQRQASEKRAAEIGLENLARTAGYEDPTRLGWAMEARGIADLAAGPVRVRAEGVDVALAIDAGGSPEVTVERDGAPLKAVPAKVRGNAVVKALRARAADLRRRRSRMRASLEEAMVRGEAFSGAELAELAQHPLLWPMLERLVLVAEGGLGRPREGGRILAGHDGGLLAVGPGESVRIAHALDLLEARDWPAWQRHLLEHEVAQPFKQVFRELYVATAAERGSREGSERYAGHQLQPRRAIALLASRGWVAHREEGVRRTFHREGVTASLWVAGGLMTPAEVEPPAVELVRFTRPGDWEPIPVGDVPPRIFSEVMRDVDLAVSVAHAGGVDPEASASTVEMRAALVAETCRMLDVGNVRVDEPRVLIDGELGEYSVHLGSATVHRRPGGAVCIVPVSGQQRGRLFLPFADDDPRTAEVLAKVLLLARDREIRDPGILEQLRS